MIPQHIAIVMDGNGRWAEKRKLPRLQGHKAGVDAVKTAIRCCLEKGIPFLSLFAFSSENWRRPQGEVAFLMELFLQSLEKELPVLHENQIGLRFLGDMQGLSIALQQCMRHAEEYTRNNQKLHVNIVINYGGRWDIVQATQHIAQKIVTKQLELEEIDEELVRDHLCTQGIPDPDLFIRTSGEQRLSNFFLMQLAYTELYFPACYWPDFDEKEFHKALQNFHRRERRYGKTHQQLTEG
jgi:undecaprenyl diphosphate synthase